MIYDKFVKTEFERKKAVDYILKVACQDEKGLILRVSDVVFKFGLNFVDTNEFVDHEKERFFMRAVVRSDKEDATLASQLKNTLSAFLPSGAEIFFQPRRKQKILILATKESHCVGDLLIRAKSGEINAEILAVIANRIDLKDLVERFDLPFIFVDSDGKSRAQHEEEVAQVMSKFEFDYAVLAKYMRILSDEFVSKFELKIINIHHSFLPAFIGANPYKQAYERGVKIIGATAHFVTSDLDEGPIITQNVASVNHAMTWQQMRNVGRNVEKVVLSTALDLVFDERVFVFENKTIIF